MRQQTGQTESQSLGSGERTGRETGVEEKLEAGKEGRFGAADPPAFRPLLASHIMYIQAPNQAARSAMHGIVEMFEKSRSITGSKGRRECPAVTIGFLDREMNMLKHLVEQGREYFHQTPVDWSVRRHPSTQNLYPYPRANRL